MVVTDSYSLQNRLLLSVSVLLAVFLGLTGVVLDRAFRASLEAGVAEQLQVQIYVLLAAVDESDGSFYFSENLREPRFTQLNSGLYGFISSADNDELLRTSSALELDFDTLQLQHDMSRGETRFSRIRSTRGVEYFVSSYAVIWENRGSPVVFTALESTQTYLLAVNNFRANLWSWLGGLAVLLLILQLVLLRWGLAPLRRLARDLKHIEKGDSEALGVGYPRELSAVTQNLNLLIQSERKQQQRYRTTLGDLAHSLKTPLAVIQGELTNLQISVASQDAPAVVIQEQVDRMNQLVSYQLQRAVRSDDINALARQVNISRVVENVCRALEKVYADRHIMISRNIDAQLKFMGDERDLLEIVGNLLDNACKYGGNKITVTAQFDAVEPSLLHLIIEDNGTGISAQDRERVLQRGVRLDSLAPGQGIGLAVVADIVQSYGGQIDISQASAGGASVRVSLNNIRRSD